MIVIAEAGNNDSGFVAALADRDCRIDRDHDRASWRQASFVRRPFLDQIARPSAPWTSSRISALSSWRPSRVPS